MIVNLKLKEFDELEVFDLNQELDVESDELETEDLPVEDQIAIARTHTESLLYIVNPDKLPMVHYLLKMVKIELDSAENAKFYTK